MDKDIVYYSKKRFAAKAYDATKKISADNIDKIKNILRFSPSSTNMQPWHFFIASTDESKELISRAATGKFNYNSPNIINASHVVVFCILNSLSEKQLVKVLEQEEMDGRIAADGVKERVLSSRKGYLIQHNQIDKDSAHWMEKQLNLNAGQLLLAVSTLDIDATPMEGLDYATLDKELDLAKKGLKSVLAVSLGYSKKDSDFNSKLPKSRLNIEEIITEI